MVDKESRKKQLTERRQEQILKASLEIFSQKGYAGSTVPEIARAAGVATGTIYIYYPSKRELFIEAIRNFIITVPLLDLIEEMPKANFDVTFRQIIQNRLSLIDNDMVSRIPSLMGEIQRDPELKVIWAKQFIQPFFNRMERVYRIMVDSGRFRQVEPAIAARAIGGLILGFVMLKIMEGDDSPLNRMTREKVGDTLADFVFHGLYGNPGDKPDRKEKSL